jgi:hypothetical protein
MKKTRTSKVRTDKVEIAKQKAVAEKKKLILR